MLFAYIYCFIFAIFSGFGSMALTFFISPLFFYNVCYRKRIEKYLLFTLPFAVFFIMIYSAYRDANLDDLNITLYDALIKVLDREGLLKDIYNRFDYLEMYTNGQAFILNGHIEPFYSILNFIYSPIPRLLFPEKPLNFSQLFTSLLLPQNFDIGVTANFGMLNEFSYNFGQLFGILIGAIFLGYVLSVCYRRYLNSENNPYSAIFYLAVIFPYLSGGIVAGFINDLALPLLILNLIYFKFFVRIKDLEKN